MKPKEYLLKHGHIDKIGRGRLSAAHIEIIKDAVANGVRIEGYASVESNSVEVNKPKEVKKVENPSNEIVDLAPIHYPEDQFVAYEYHDGKKIERSLRSACNNCLVSLVQCVCGNPTIVARNGCSSVSVSIVRK